MGGLTSRQGLLIGAAVLVLCAGGIAVAASVGASPQPPHVDLGGPVVVGTTPTGSATGTPRPDPSAGEDHDGDDDDSPEMVDPAPVRELHDDDHHDASSAPSSHG